MARGVEDVLYGHPAVREAAVVGVPDPYRGETVEAFVSLTPGTSTTLEEIIAFANERMAAYKYPRSVELVDDLPKRRRGRSSAGSWRTGRAADPSAARSAIS